MLLSSTRGGGGADASFARIAVHTVRAAIAVHTATSSARRATRGLDASGLSERACAAERFFTSGLHPIACGAMRLCRVVADTRDHPTLMLAGAFRCRAPSVVSCA